MPLGLVDSHCHLQYLSPEEREEALDTARERGVTGFLVPAVRLSDAEDLLAFCHRHPDVWCAIGVHPHDAATWQPGDEARLAQYLPDPKVVAVGECGLDFFYDHAPRDVQAEALRAQWRMAIAHDLPVIVHNRDSNEAMLTIVAEPEFAALKADFHSFAGGLDMARTLIERDFTFGISGMVTFRQADNIRELLPVIPRDRQLVETDTPYLAPVPYRGKPNRPAYVVEVARRIAEETGETYDEVCRRTGENVRRLFEKVA